MGKVAGTTRRNKLGCIGRLLACCLQCVTCSQAAGSSLRLGSQGLHFTRVSLKCRCLSGEDVSRGDYCECLGCFLLLRVASYLMRRIHWVSKNLKFSVGRWYPTTVWYIGLGQNSNLVCRVRILNSRFQVQMHNLYLFIPCLECGNVFLLLHSFLWNYRILAFIMRHARVHVIILRISFHKKMI